MGLATFAIKAALAAFFLWAALIVYSIGEQKGALESGAAKSGSLASPLSKDILREGLIAAVQTDATGDHSDLIRAYASRAPLSELPHEAGLARSITDGDAASASRFAEQALRRQPRSLAARLHGLSEAAQAGEFQSVIAEYERIIELRAIDGNILADALVGVFRGSGDWSALVTYLKTSPSSGNQLLSRLMNESIPVSDLESLIALYPRYQSGYLERLIREGSLDQAYSAWLEFSGLSDDAPFQRPFNPSFEDRSEPPPFNWSISRDRAEFQARGGLYVTYLGTGRPRLATQVLSTPSGDYVLRSVVEGRMPEDGGSLEWTLTCIESRARFATSHILLKTIGDREVFEEVLTVPDEACAFQRLELWGRSGEFPKTSRIEMLEVTLEPFSE